MALEASSDPIITQTHNSSSNLKKIVKLDNNTVTISISPEIMSRNSSSVSCNLQGKLLVKNYLNFKESMEPGRVMYYMEDGSWVDYPKDVLDLIRNCFVEKKPVVEVNFDGAFRIIDFYRMLEVEFCSGKGRSISWIDVNGKCFFPSVFVNYSTSCCNHGEVEANDLKVSTNIPKIEVEVRICENGKGLVNSGKLMRENEEIEEVEKGKSAESGNYPQKKRLDEGEKRQIEMQHEKFLLSMIRSAEPGATITRISRVERKTPLEKAKVEVFMNQLQLIKSKRGNPNLVFAWYGTSAKGAESILTRGFDLSNQIQSPQPYGGGVHMSPVKFPHHSAMLSEVDGNGEKHMILCRVILGKCEKVEASSMQNFPSSEDFDSGVDNLDNPRRYVIWPCNVGTCILPEVVVSYKPGTTLIGQGTSNLNQKLPTGKVTISGLLSKLKRFLPATKVRELEALYSSYKVGRIGRDMFTRHLRYLVGDELRSVIHEIYGGH